MSCVISWITDAICLSCANRIRRRLFSPRCGRLPHAQVNIFLPFSISPNLRHHTPCRPLTYSRLSLLPSDVMSLVVALYAIRVRFLCSVPCVILLTPPMHQLSAKSEANDRYTYGWHRAEILAALVNGVFLLALCFSVSLEALERFFSAPGKFKTPMWVGLTLIHSIPCRNHQSQTGRHCRLFWTRIKYRRTVPVPRYATRFRCCLGDPELEP
jgi:hypothetical protein